MAYYGLVVFLEQFSESVENVLAVTVRCAALRIRTQTQQDINKAIQRGGCSARVDA